MFPFFSRPKGTDDISKSPQKKNTTLQHLQIFFFFSLAGIGKPARFETKKGRPCSIDTLYLLRDKRSNYNNFVLAEKSNCVTCRVGTTSRDKPG